MSEDDIKTMLDLVVESLQRIEGKIDHIQTREPEQQTLPLDGSNRETHSVFTEQRILFHEHVLRHYKMEEVRIRDFCDNTAIRDELRKLMRGGRLTEATIGYYFADLVKSGAAVRAKHGVYKMLPMTPLAIQKLDELGEKKWKSGKARSTATNEAVL